MKQKWILPQVDAGRVKQLAQDLRVCELTARMLLNRGLTDARNARRFLEPSLHELRDPCKHPVLSDVATFLRDAVAAGRRITIYGDYDADGICATALLVNCLRAAGGNVDSYIPHRVDDGYGLNCAALDELKARGTEVVVTVDCGISAHAEARHAARLGLDLVVTDHHEPGREPCPAPYVLNPHLPQCGFGYQHLAGVGVAFKLAWAVGQQMAGGANVAESFRDLLVEALPLVAIGTIADVAPLADENRVLAHYGLRLLPQSRNPGVRALLEVAGAADKASLGTYHVAFQLAPRLNAAGRMAHARGAVDMLTCDDGPRATELAQRLEQENRRRQSVQRAATDQARACVESGTDMDTCGCIVLSSPDWHPGVVGLVASRLAEEFCRPTFILCEQADVARGSGRSIHGFHLFDAVAQCEDLLERFGGHEGAAGVTVSAKNLTAFAERMDSIAREQLGPEPALPLLELEGEVSLAELSRPVVEEMQRLEPFGAGNPDPLFSARDIRLAGNPQLVGSRRNHLSFLARQGNVTLRVIAFGKADWLKQLQSRRQEPFSLAFQPSINSFNGARTVEMRAEDIQWQSEELIEVQPVVA